VVPPFPHPRSVAAPSDLHNSSSSSSSASMATVQLQSLTLVHSFALPSATFSPLIAVSCPRNSAALRRPPALEPLLAVEVSSARQETPLLKVRLRFRCGKSFSFVTVRVDLLFRLCVCFAILW